MDGSLQLLRRQAVEAYLAAVEAVQPRHLIPRAVTAHGGEVAVFGRPLPRAPGRRVLAALGKAAPGLAEAWLGCAPSWASEVFVLAPHGVPVAPELAARATVRRGAHPFPDADGEASARALLELAGGLGARDLLVVLLSGGASALLAAPRPGLTLEDVTATTRALLGAGAPITALNTVRRQLLTAAGGGLGRAAHPAPVVTLVLSDVLGDSLPDIASGPTVPSPTTAVDALQVLERYGVRRRVPGAVLQALERGQPTAAAATSGWSERASTHLLANNHSAVTAAASWLEDRAFAVTVLRPPLTGEAAARGRQLGALAVALRPARRVALVLGGETTVTVRGRGRGGRSQELALAAAIELEGSLGCALLAAGSDGLDGLSAHAGAVVDPTTCRRLRAAGHDPLAALVDNDSATALAACGDALVTGPTWTNVCDLVLVLADGTSAA